MSSAARAKESQIRHAQNLAQGKAAIAEKQKTLWDKSGLAPYREKIGPERVAGDKRKIESIFNMAAKVPALKEALDWANDHGVDFIIDRNMTAWGMYHPGTGILSISETLFEEDRKGLMVDALTHEIRHAWQDWNGLLPAPSANFTGLYIQQSLIEADAFAYGFRAVHQLKVHEAGSRETDDGVLLKGFAQWFTSKMADSYGIRTLISFAKAFKIPFVSRDGFESKVAERNAIAPEFRHPTFRVRTTAGITPDADGLAALGRGFKGGGNYFDSDARDTILRKIFAPSAALAFFKAGAKPHPLAEVLRKKEVKNHWTNMLGSPRHKQKRLPG